jgi:hypothetical protein
MLLKGLSMSGQEYCSVEELAPMWERQPEESGKAWSAFREYRDMGSCRSIRRVAAKLRVTRQALEPWSRKFNWVERAEAIDDHEYHLRLREVAAIKRAQLGGVDVVKSPALKRLLNPTQKDLDKLSIAEAASIYDRMLKQEHKILFERSMG